MPEKKKPSSTSGSNGRKPAAPRATTSRASTPRASTPRANTPRANTSRATKPRAGAAEPVETVEDAPAEVKRARPVAVSPSSSRSVLDEGDVVPAGDAGGGGSRFEETGNPIESLLVKDSPIPPPESLSAEEFRPASELLVGGASVLLAASVFLPWYSTTGGDVHASGWASGTWGPVVFFLALAGAAIVGLRRLKIPVSFPVEIPLVLEGIGWISVLGVLAKRMFRPKIVTATFTGFSLDSTRVILVPLLAAIAVAFLAGRMSGNTPFVLRPGWFADRAGKLGAGILAVALVAGGGFGYANTAIHVKKSTPQAAPAVTTVKGLPSCIRDARFPVPSGARPVSGYQAKDKSSCVAIFSSSLSLAKLSSRFRASLKAAGWRVRAFPGLPAAQSLQILKPRCGMIALIDKSGTRTATVLIERCRGSR